MYWVHIWSTVDEDAYLGEMSVIIVYLKQVSMHIIIILYYYNYTRRLKAKGNHNKYTCSRVDHNKYTYSRVGVVCNTNT